MTEDYLKCLTIGIVFGVLIYMLCLHTTKYTYVYVTKKNIKLENKIVIPENTKLILRSKKIINNLILQINIDGSYRDRLIKVERRWLNRCFPYRSL